MNTTTTSHAVSRWVIFMLALGAGFSVASIYYAQPLLPLMGADLHLSIEGMGLVPTLTQAGYALGILFLLPLGDRHDRRTLILIKSAALALFLLGCSLTGQIHSLLLASLLIGMAATMAQDIVPAAAILAPEGKQGKTVGTVMTGLLTGYLIIQNRKRRGGRSVWLARHVPAGSGEHCVHRGNDVVCTSPFCHSLHAELPRADALDGAPVASLSGTAPRGAGSGFPVDCL